MKYCGGLGLRLRLGLGREVVRNHPMLQRCDDILHEEGNKQTDTATLSCIGHFLVDGGLH